MSKTSIDSEHPTAAPAVHRKLVTAACLLAMAVSALEQLVVSTAMPTIVSQLQGFALYSWVVSGFLIASTVPTPIYGKLADRIGRKPVLLFGLGLFSAGSMLSGLAQSMPQLVAFRVIQGLGAGAILPIVLTLMGDIYSLRERARVQGLFSGVWGAASLAGPIVGGYLTDHFSWRWVFFLTIPFSILTAFVLTGYYYEPRVERARHGIDWWGAALLALASASLLWLALEGRSTGWLAGSLTVLGVLILIGGFLWVESRATDPILPLDLCLRRPIAASILGSFLIGVMIFGLDTFVPIYVQGVRGQRAMDAGRMLTPLFLSWSVSVVIAARVVVRWGFRVSAVVGSTLVTLGAAWIWWIFRAGQPAWHALPGTVLVGLGLGPTALSFLLGVQTLVPWNRRGVATSAIAFFRTIGGALGVGLLAAILAQQVQWTLAPIPDAERPDVTSALRPETHGQLRPDLLRHVQDGLRLGLDGVFLTLVFCGAGSLACSGMIGGIDGNSGIDPNPIQEG